jgi:ankyrin repeat protein
MRMHDIQFLSLSITHSQACRNNLVQHLEHLLAYGADMNSKNSTGNTALHGNFLIPPPPRE